MRPGDRIHVQAYKADGIVYRSWMATIESIEKDSIVTIAPANDPVKDRKRGLFYTRHALRAYYWTGANYNLIEAFDTKGVAVEIYVNIASPPQFMERGIRFTDYELDVSKLPPAPARIVDEDEFAEAVVQYRYSEEFQERMIADARKAVELADRWQAMSAPIFGGEHA
ncbi:MAG: DUF402 domain-containing protein [Chloroflexi bacterium]|nr:DUF402 domain-containing protein [Chloroflexota bacterium]